MAFLVAKSWPSLGFSKFCMRSRLATPVSPLIIAAAAIIAKKMAADPMRTTNVARIAGKAPLTSRMVADSVPMAWGRSRATLRCLVLAKVGGRAQRHVRAGMLGPRTFILLPFLRHSYWPVTFTRTPSEQRGPKPHSSSSGSGEVACLHCSTPSAWSWPAGVRSAGRGRASAGLRRVISPRRGACSRGQGS